MENKIFVLDTNIWVSFILNRQFFHLAEIIINNDLVILSCDELLTEISEVLLRPKISRYISKSDFQEAVTLVNKLTKPIKLKEIKKYTKDPGDDYLFELALQGKAEYIVSGDKHILNCEIIAPLKTITLNYFLDLFQ
jgi:uncharacterized protein